MKLPVLLASIFLAFASYSSISVSSQTTPPSPPATPPSTEPSKPDEDPEKVKVWVTPSGKKYHKSTCRYAKDASSITLKEARAKGLTACKTCGGH